MKIRLSPSILDRNTKNIGRSLHRRPDLALDHVRQMYEEAKFALNDSVVHRLEEVIQFHQNVLNARLSRLNDERQRLQARRAVLEREIVDLGTTLDEKMQYLGSHGALGDLMALKDQANDLSKRIGKLEDFKLLRQKYEDEAARIRAELVALEIKARDYLKAHESLKDENLNLFRSLSKEFYHDKPGGIDVVVNPNENQLAFDINVKLQADASDGINEVKIFCYDLTVLAAARSHRVAFLFHDSRLFSNMDPRQRATSIRLAETFASKYSLQYIATLNHDQLETASKWYDETEVEKLVIASTIMELTDESEATKLLGVDVDLDFGDE